MYHQSACPQTLLYLLPGRSRRRLFSLSARRSLHTRVACCVASLAGELRETTLHGDQRKKHIHLVACSWCAAASPVGVPALPVPDVSSRMEAQAPSVTGVRKRDRYTHSKKTIGFCLSCLFSITRFRYCSLTSPTTSKLSRRTTGEY